MPEIWKPKPGDRVVRHPRQEEIGPVHLTVTARKAQPRAFASPLILIYAFAGLITLGTLLLLLPASSQGRGAAPFMDTLFTATSAVTVTGLVVHDTATYWTRFGQVVILGLMFVGGLGFMTIATFLLILIGHRVTLAQRLLVKESLGVDQLGGLVRLTVIIVLVAAAIQVAGFMVLFIRFSFLYSPPEAVWQAVFHAVSGFNNAGFVALKDPGGFAALRNEQAVIATIAVLVALGSISFYVMVDVVRFRRFSLFSLNTKLVVVVTSGLFLLGTLVFLSSEYQNPETLGPLPVEDKIVFESISGRTAGFTTVDFGATRAQTNFFFSGLMFIGGASASVAGGVKVNTVAVILVALVAIFRGRSHASAFSREIPQAQIQRAMTIVAVAMAFVFLEVALLASVESGFDFMDLLFEGVSAFGTVGLSSGITPLLSGWGHAILMVAMFVGRLGPLTIGLAMAQSSGTDAYRYASERVTIG